MVEEIWRWQGGTPFNDSQQAFAYGVGGSIVLAGHTEGDWYGSNQDYTDFVAIGLDADGEIEWGWQDGTSGYDHIVDASVGEDGSTFLFGTTANEWVEPSVGSFDFVVTKIDSNGTLVWGWQDGSEGYEVPRSGVVRSDGSVFFVGYTDGGWNGSAIGEFDFAGALLSADGNELWRWQAGTIEDDYGLGVTLGEDDSLIISGSTSGSWYASNEGDFDVVVMKLDRDENLVWGWQGGSESTETSHACIMGADGSIYVGAYTLGDFAGDVWAGGTDLAAVKLDNDGNELWRWQEGTEEDDKVRSVTVDEDGSMILSGMTEGSWNSTNAGGSDVIVAKLETDGKVSWRWQAGTSGNDDSYGVAAGADGTIKVGMVVKGDWNGSSFGGSDFGAVALSETGSNDGASNSTVAPSGTPAPRDFQSSTSPPTPEDFERITPTASGVYPTQPTTYSSSGSSLISTPSSTHPANPSLLMTEAPSRLHSSSPSSPTQPVVLTSVAAAAVASVVGGLGLYLW